MHTDKQTHSYLSRRYRINAVERRRRSRNAEPLPVDLSPQDIDWRLLGAPLPRGIGAHSWTVKYLSTACMHSDDVFWKRRSPTGSIDAASWADVASFNDNRATRKFAGDSWSWVWTHSHLRSLRVSIFDCWQSDSHVHSPSMKFVMWWAKREETNSRPLLHGDWMSLGIELTRTFSALGLISFSQRTKLKPTLHSHLKCCGRSRMRRMRWAQIKVLKYSSNIHDNHYPSPI